MASRLRQERGTTGVGLTVAACLFAIGGIPYLVGWLSAPPDRVFTGLVFNVADHTQYWSWIAASRVGLFIGNTMTPEPNPPSFMNPLMWLLACIQSAFDLSFPSLFQVWRALSVALLGVALVAGVRAFVEERIRRTTAFWVALVGSGFGWALVAWKHLLRLPDVPFPNDIYVAEPNTLFSTYAYPYLALAQGLVLSTLVGAWRAHRDGHASQFVLAAASALALALSHAYDLITVYAVLGTYWIVLVLRSRRIPVRLTMVGAMIASTSAPIAWYYHGLTANDPLWQAVLAQYVNAGVWTPPHVHLLLLMGLPLLLAAAAIPGAFRADDARPFLATWTLVGLGLIYVPTVFQIKLLTGWQFPLAVLAAFAWHDGVVPFVTKRIGTPWWTRRAREWHATAVLVLLIAPTNVYLFAWRLAELRGHQAPFFLHRDERAALEWLAGNATSEDVVLAPLAIGQFVPNLGHTRAFLAHWAMTNRFYERRDAAERFFASDTPEAERAEILDRDRVTLVMRPSAQAPGSTYDPAGSALFRPVFVTPRASIFRYRATTSERSSEVRAR